MKLPKAWIQAGAPKEKVTARIDMSAEVAGKGLCPECRGQMVSAYANGHKVLVCDEDRIVIPVVDDEQAEVVETQEV